MGDYKDEEQESVNKTLEGEKKKLSQMTAGQKAEYIFTYYKLHILGIILVVALIIYIINRRLNYVDYKLYGVVINSYTADETVAEKLTEELGMDKHEGVSFLTGLSADVDGNSASYINQLDLYTMSGEMDFAFTDEAGAQHLCDLGTPLDVTDQLSLDLLKLWSTRTVEFSQMDSDTEEYYDNYAAIDISGTAVQDYFGLDDSTCYLLLIDLSGNEDYMQAFYNLLYDIETGKVQ